MEERDIFNRTRRMYCAIYNQHIINISCFKFYKSILGVGIYKSYLTCFHWGKYKNK